MSLYQTAILERVYRNGALVDFPERGRLIRVSRAASAQKQNTADFELPVQYDTQNNLRRPLPMGQIGYSGIQNKAGAGTFPPEVEPQIIEIFLLDVDGNEYGVHLGTPMSNVSSIKTEEDYEVLQTRTEDFFFGNLFEWIEVWDGTKSRAVDAHTPLVFNPRIRDVEYANMTTVNKAQDVSGRQYSLLMLPGQLDYQKVVQGVHFEEPDFWKLEDAVEYFCSLLNGSEDYIKNPTRAELESIFAGEEPLKNVAIQYNQYLPKCLEQLFGNRNYVWFIDHVAVGDHRLRITKLGQHNADYHWHTARQLPLQKVGETLSLDTTQQDERLYSSMYEGDFTFNVVNTINELIGLGDYMEVEYTFPLWPAWVSSNDTANRIDLIENKSLKNIKTAGLNLPEWRRWMLNIDDRMRVEWERAIPPVFDMGAVFDTEFHYTGDPSYNDERPSLLDVPLELATQNRFFPMLSGEGSAEFPDAAQNGFFLEWRWWYVKDGQEIQSDWHPLTGIVPKYRVMKHAFGIELAQPFEFIKAVAKDSDAAQVECRLTCCVRSTSRMRYEAISDKSVSPVRNRRVMEMQSATYRAIAQDSVFWTQANNNEVIANVRNDYPLLKRQTDTMLDTQDRAGVSGNFMLHGLMHKDYYPGQPITGIAGRNVPFNMRDSNVPSEEQRYPSITGIRYSLSEQNISIQIEPPFVSR